MEVEAEDHQRPPRQGRHGGAVSLIDWSRSARQRASSRCDHLMLSACATTTPIAVRTPQWHVPPVSQPQRQAENAALSHAATSLNDWQSAVTSLPQASASSEQDSKPASATETH